MAETSILTAVKSLLGVPQGDTGYDLELRIHINSALFSLYDCGVGTDVPYMLVSGEETWSTFSEADKAVDILTMYVYLKTKLVFDPPTNATVAEAIAKQLQEIEWRITQQRERDSSVVIPNPLP